MNTPPGEWEVSGWRIKVEQGRKGPDDRRIWVASPGGDYSLLTLSTLGAITALWCRNEELLYPPTRGARGGQYVIDFLSACWADGLRKACAAYKLRDPLVRRLDESDKPDLKVAA